MQTGRIPPADGRQGAARQEEEDEENQYQHGNAQQFQREHPLLVLLLPVSREDLSGGGRQPAALQQHARQHAGGAGDGRRAGSSAAGFWLHRRTVRQRGGRGLFHIFHEPQDAPGWSRDGTLLTFPVPVHFSASGSICMDILHVPKKPSMQQEQQPSPRYQSVVYLAIAHPFPPSFTLAAGCINQGLDWEEVVPAVQNENKGCPPASRSRQTTERHRRSSHSSLRPLRSPVLVPARPQGLKGKSSCLHPGCFVCFCQRERRKAARRSVAHVLLPAKPLQGGSIYM